MIADIVIGNNSRGKIINKPLKKSDYIYGFDKENKLCTVIKDSDGCMDYEYIIHEDNYEVGINFDTYGLGNISECKYDKCGCLIEYTTYLFLDVNENPTEIIKEQYEYYDNQVNVHFWQYMHGFLWPMLSHQEYICELEDGYFVNYTIEEYDAKGNKKESDNIRYTTTIKRKII